MTSGGLVARWGRHWLASSGHDVAGLRRRVLGQHGGRSLVHGGRLGVLAGALSTQRHLAELRGQFVTLRRPKGNRSEERVQFCKKNKK